VFLCVVFQFNKKEPFFFLSLVSVSPTFYAQLLYTKVSYASFLNLHFRFVRFWRTNIGVNAAHKMLVKLTSSLIKRIRKIVERTKNFFPFVPTSKQSFFPISLNRKFTQRNIIIKRAKKMEQNNDILLTRR
jgi:hypothetical protein